LAIEAHFGLGTVATVVSPTDFLGDIFGKASKRMTRLRTVLELFTFLMQNKRWWLVPMLVVLILFGTLLLLSETSVVAPFIYTLF